MSNQDVFNAALDYKNHGLDVIPNHPIHKYPFGYNSWEKREFTEDELRKEILVNGWSLGVRGIEGLDFDNHNNSGIEDIFKQWIKLVETQSPGLVKKLLVERTPSNGFHVVWLCEEIEPSKKIARRKATESELAINPNEKVVLLIETRGSNGQFVVSPSKGYSLLNGSWTNLPTITKQERLILLNSASSFDQLPAREYKTQATGEGDRPGDLYNETGASEVLSILKKHGWTIAYERDDAYYLTRPGKKFGISATLGYVAPGIFYNFSSSAAPFEPGTAYKPFSVLALLEFDGDFSEAARYLVQQQELATPVEPSETKNLSRLLLEYKEIQGLNTGLKKLDDRFHFYPGINVVVGQPGSGKSWLVTWLALRFWQQHQIKSLFFSLEMGEDLIVNRVLQQWSGMSREEMELKDPEVGRNYIKQGFFLINSLDTNSVKYFLEESEKQINNGVRVIFFDHLHQIPGMMDSKRNRGLSQIWGEAFELLRKKYPEVVMIILAQPNKSAYDKVALQIGDISDCSPIINKCDIFLGISNDQAREGKGFTESMDSGKAPGGRLFWCDKNRISGQSQVGIKLYFAPNANLYEFEEDYIRSLDNTIKPEEPWTPPF